MRRSSDLATQVALSALALWMGLWPAGDAITGASRTVVVMVSEVPATAAASACSLEHPADPADHDAGCCRSSCDRGDAARRCPTGKTSRSCHCLSLGGMVLFAAAQPTLETDHALVGTLCSCCLVGPSRHLQPPVPPPWSIA